MVYEFPELQGKMGHEYALRGGEKAEVAAAIEEHYLPKHLGQSAKELAKTQSKLGSLVAVIDKMDTLVGAFGIGLEPSGSQDPYALRRAGGGLIKILRAFGYRFDLGGLIREIAGLYGDKLTRSADEIVMLLGSFFTERIAFDLGIRAGTREDQIFRGVMRTSWADVGDVFLRYQTLLALNQNDKSSFEKACKVVERTHNIIKGAKGKIPDNIDEGLLQEPLEKKLFSLMQDKRSEIEELGGSEKFEQMTKMYADTFYETVHDFFEQVLVNVDDTSIRANRQALIKSLNRLYSSRVADLSLVSHLA